MIGDIEVLKVLVLVLVVEVGEGSANGDMRDEGEIPAARYATGIDPGRRVDAGVVAGVERDLLALVVDR